MYSAKFICVFSEDNLELLLVYIASGKIHSLHTQNTLKKKLKIICRESRNLIGKYGIQPRSQGVFPSYTDHKTD